MAKFNWARIASIFVKNDEFDHTSGDITKCPYMGNSSYNNDLDDELSIPEKPPIKSSNLIYVKNEAKLDRQEFDLTAPTPFNLGFYAGHDAAVAISKDDVILEVVEIERITGVKHDNLYITNFTIIQIQQLISDVLRHFSETYGATTYNTVYWNGIMVDEICVLTFPAELAKVFPAKEFQHIKHHLAHSNGSLYQSPFKKAIVVSFDGGSDSSVLNVDLCETGLPAINLYKGTTNYCNAYAVIGHYIEQIKFETDKLTGLLVYPGKIMGLAAHGLPDPNLVNTFSSFFKIANGANGTYEEFSAHMKFPLTVRATGNTGISFAASAQAAFEQVFYDEISRFIQAEHKLPLILSGGGALNIINNSKIAQEICTFVPPNPNDSGIAVGLLCDAIKPSNQVICTYLGPNVWDADSLLSIVKDCNGTQLDLDVLADELINGKIYGVVQGRSEHGPRALGNRSILCSATIPEMKATLNSKIKGRESFRPFAPVVRLEDLNLYFDDAFESPYMSFNFKVKEQFVDQLAAVSNVDNTARVQTVTCEQNPMIYNLLTKMHEKTGIGMLLNTSFNIDGQAILNRYSDALHILNTKDINGIVLEDYVITK